MREVEEYRSQRALDACLQPLYPRDAQVFFEVTDVLKATEKKACFLATCDGGRTRCVIKAAYQGLDVEYRFMTEHFNDLPGLIPCPVAYWEQEGKQYLMRRYVEGQTLNAFYRAQAPLPKKQVRQIGEALSRALEKLHSLGLVHRDLKPENILWTAKGDCVLIDMETVRRPSPEKPYDTVSLGTPAYASPEQLCDRQTDVRSDVYGLGRVLLYLVTGSDSEKDVKALKGRCGRVIRRCVAFAPERRYASVKAAREALNGRRAWKTAAACLALCSLCLFAGFAATRNLYLAGNKPLAELLTALPMDRASTVLFLKDVSLDQPLVIDGCHVTFAGNAALTGDHDGNAMIKVAPGASLRLKDGITLQSSRTGTLVDNHGSFALEGGVLRLSGATDHLVGIFNDHGDLTLLRGSVEVDSSQLLPGGYTLTVHNVRGRVFLQNAHLSNLHCPAAAGVLQNNGGECDIAGGSLYASADDVGIPISSAVSIEGGVINVTGGQFSPAYVP